MAIKVSTILNITTEERIIFPSIYRDIKIISIHRIMLDRNFKMIPATIMNAKTKEMKELRDISIVLSMMYINNKDKLNYVVQYFKLDLDTVKNILKYSVIKYYDKIQVFQKKLKLAYGFTYYWDIRNDCELTKERINELKGIAIMKFIKELPPKQRTNKVVNYLLEKKEN